MKKKEKSKFDLLIEKLNEEKKEFEETLHMAKVVASQRLKKSKNEVELIKA